MPRKGTPKGGTNVRRAAKKRGSRLSNIMGQIRSGRKKKPARKKKKDY